MSRTVFALLALLVATAGARMAYQLPDGADSILKARTFTQNFDCADRRYGYYADTDNDCQIFHVCLPIEDDAGQIVETAHFSFICGNQTIFDQSTLTCNDEENALPCDEAKNFYDVINAEFGVLPEQ
ncbi:U-scoloptoxin(01)-Cw1a-like [Hyalella azteca]|uniref:U-scoloptoxin(01)-Cw1a-like n=1 Tax=Hyalella azteca TaxID=294128 RepID=A0A8B7PAI9_HYAAZ|nr:U-scoloptoxin(01)-Cw1a-like [Hyalella azteca]